MANMCMNFVLFTGRLENIARLKQQLEADIDLQQQQGVGIGNLHPIRYFFDLSIVESTPTTILLHYETIWSPNTEDLAEVCREYGVTATCDYQEDGLDVRGTTIYNADGTYKDFPMEQEFLDLILYDENEDIYSYAPNGDKNNCRDELIEKWYPKWKEVRNEK